MTVSHQEPVMFGRYLLDSRIATGGMGEVFLARIQGPAGFEKKVVIKRVLPHLAEAPEFVDRFLDEARLVVQLNHGNIVQVVDMGRVDEHYFLAMEYVDGLDLRKLLQRLPDESPHLPSDLAAFVVSEVAKGLSYAHERRAPNGSNLDIIHRDISPSNIMISRSGEVKLLDFGIAKAAGRMTHSISGSLHGKFLYMSPEQAAGKNLDPRSDLFSLGTCFYELLTGLRPFDGKTELETLALIRECEYTPLAEVRPDVPAELVEILETCMQSDPNHRYPSANALHRAFLDYFLTAQLIVSNEELQGYTEPFLTETAPQKPLSLDDALNQELNALLTPGSNVSAGTRVAATPVQVALADTLSGAIPAVERKDSGATTRSRVVLPETDVPRRSRNRILIASVVLLVVVLVTLNLMTLDELRKRPTPPPEPDGVSDLAATSPGTKTKAVATAPSASAEKSPSAVDSASTVAPPTPEEPVAPTPTVPPVKDNSATADSPAPNTAVKPANDGATGSNQPRVKMIGLAPGARVLLNGNQVTPTAEGEIVLPPGDQPVAVEVANKGRALFKSTVTPTPGQVVTLNVRTAAKKQWVTIKASPKTAAIVIGGRKVGVGSARYVVTVDRPARGKVVQSGYETKTFQATYGGRKQISVRLKAKAMGGMLLRVVPASVVVRVDGKVVKPASRQINRVTHKLPPGKHTLVVRTVDGSRSKRRTFIIEAGKTTRLGHINLAGD